MGGAGWLIDSLTRAAGVQGPEQGVILLEADQRTRLGLQVQEQKERKQFALQMLVQRHSTCRMQVGVWLALHSLPMGVSQ